MPVASRIPLRRPAVALVAALAALALAGCVETPPTLPSPTVEPSIPVTGPTPAPEPDATPTAAPVRIACGRLVAADAVYDLNPNLLLLEDWTPASGSAAAAAVAADGVACHWMLESGAGALDVSVAALDAADLDRRRDAAGEATDAFGADGYFSPAGGRGTATVISGAHWIVVESELFGGPGDAAGVVASVLDALS